MSRAGGEVEFEFLDDGSDAGNFVATGKVVPMLTTLLAKGSVEEAMHLFEGCEASVAADLLAQAKTMSSVSLKNLGAMFQMARDFSSAAKVFEFGKKYADAAKSYEQGSDYVSAARNYGLAGDLPKAAAALERAGKPDLALEIHQKIGPSEAMAECMVRQHLYWDAAKVFQQLGNARGEVESLRLVPVNSPNRIIAVKRLGDLLEQFGHMAPAAQILVETLQQVPGAQNDGELLTTLIRRLETMGKHDHAEKVRGFAQRLLGAGAVAAAAPIPVVGGMPMGGAPRSSDPFRASDPFGGAPASAPSAPAFASPPPSAPRPSAPPPTSADPFGSFVDPFGGGAPAPSPSAPSAAPAVPAVTGMPVNDGYGQLKAIPIFGELALPDMKDLYRISEAITYAPGFTIIEQGVQGAGLIVILQGSIQVVRVDGGKTTPLATLGPSAYVGELSLVDDAPTSARVVAQTAVRALMISRQRFQQYLYTHEQAAPRIYMLFTRTLAERLRNANKRS